MRPRPKGEPQEVASQLFGPAPEDKASLTKYHGKLRHCLIARRVDRKETSCYFPQGVPFVNS